jgi:hypothetical protein
MYFMAVSPFGTGYPRRQAGSPSSRIAYYRLNSATRPTVSG